MADYLTLLTRNSFFPLLLIISTGIISYLVIRLLLRFSKKKNPEKIIASFLWKLHAKTKKEEINTIEDVYKTVMEHLKRYGVLERNDKFGFASRKKALERVDPKKREILEHLFCLYEAKVYGEKEIKNEKEISSKLLSVYFGS